MPTEAPTTLPTSGTPLVLFVSMYSSRAHGYRQLVKENRRVVFVPRAPPQRGSSSVTLLPAPCTSYTPSKKCTHSYPCSSLLFSSLWLDDVDHSPYRSTNGRAIGQSHRRPHPDVIRPPHRKYVTQRETVVEMYSLVRREGEKQREMHDLSTCTRGEEEQSIASDMGSGRNTIRR